MAENNLAYSFVSLDVIMALIINSAMRYSITVLLSFFLVGVLRILRLVIVKTYWLYRL